MAKITNHKYFTLSASVWGKKDQVKVGNNRTIHLNQRLNVLECKLHGHTIVVFDKAGNITLDPCGYWTTTTRQAMKDFVEVMTGMICNPSFAKGKFSARVGGMDYEPDDAGVIEIRGRG